jgi:DsbC/DsbD-like thiol-disulfide interchange protein
MTQFVPRAAALALVLAAPLAAAPQPARAQSDASPWIRESHSALRLVAGPRSGGFYFGGIAIKLQPGWKTYWRTPGDSGVPPRFDFAGSSNLGSATVLWPAPLKFPDGAGGTSYGYHDEVLLPLRITPADPDKPVTLRATINYAVCEKLCVPVEAKTEISLTGSTGSADGALAAALAGVPQPAKIGDTHPLAVRAVRRDGNRVLVDVASPPGLTPDLFAEGPTPDWSLPPPEPAGDGEGGTRRFAFALDGLPPGAKPDGALLKLTLTGAPKAARTAAAAVSTAGDGDRPRAWEVEVRLD